MKPEEVERRVNQYKNDKHRENICVAICRIIEVSPIRLTISETKVEREYPAEVQKQIDDLKQQLKIYDKANYSDILVEL